MTQALPKVDVFGVGVTPCSYDGAVEQIIAAGRDGRAFGVTALAVHGLMTGVNNAAYRAQLARLDIVAPDGQPVRWALNLRLDEPVRERVCGRDLVDRTAAAAAAEGVGMYLFGSSESTCTALGDVLLARHSGLKIVGMQADRFRDATADEDADDIARIRDSGAGVVLVGRGCPRQEEWVADHLDSIPAAMLAVGAAFDYLAGTLARPPRWIERAGLEWLHRLLQEPRRLWRRYLVTNTQFLLRFAPEWLRSFRRRRG